jgi:2-iminobutanoate/2-iminopropanoate deaminase
MEKKKSDIIRVTTPYTYSAAVKAGDYVFLGLHRGFGDTFSDQHENTFEYLKKTLEELGMKIEDIIKVQVWLKDIEDLPTMEKLFANHFEKDKYPARMTSTTQFIDADCLLMIEGIAYQK